MRAAFAAIGRFDVRFRYLIVAVWVIGGIVGIRLLPNLSAVNNFANLQFVPASSPSQQANVLAQPFQGAMASSSSLNPQTATLVASRMSGPLTPADLAAIGQVEQESRQVPGVSHGSSQQFGFGIAFAVALDTFFVRTLLVPSIAMLLGRWNWWPASSPAQPVAAAASPDARSGR